MAFFIIFILKLQFFLQHSENFNFKIYDRNEIPNFENDEKTDFLILILI